jgi:3',5'-cyclic AMP phosphodiesterase CpdA
VALPVIVAAGDIACDPRTPELPCKDRETATIAGNILSQHVTGFVVALGDLQYDSGTVAEFNAVYDRSWGQLAGRTRPIPGNHEYQTARASGYFDYFLTRGVNVGDRPTGWYEWQPAPTWDAVALNSECGAIGGCGAGSPQERWLSQIASRRTRPCQVAFMHHPFFSSGLSGSITNTRALLQVLVGAGVELVLSGHDHMYERFEPQTVAGALDRARGIRQFVVGTGGRDLYTFEARNLKANSAFRYDQNYGVLKLVLRDSSYDWAFVTIDGKIIDSGSASCF